MSTQPEPIDRSEVLKAYASYPFDSDETYQVRSIVKSKP